MNNICKLCLLEKPLLNQSHIIPDFIYRNGNVYNENHSIEIFSLDDLKNNRKSRNTSSGEYEGNILCQECDNVILGSYENYGRKLIYGGFKKSEEIACSMHINDNGLKFSFCTNVNYKLSKLYLISIFWRMSISSRPFFKNVKLKDEEIFREMLLQSNPKHFFEYPIYSSYFIHDKTIPKNIIAEPQHYNINGEDRVILILPGFIHMLETTTKEDKSVDQKHLVVNEEGEFTMMELEDGQTMQYLMKFRGNAGTKTN